MKSTCSNVQEAWQHRDREHSAVLHQLKELRSHIDIKAAAGLGASNAEVAVAESELGRPGGPLSQSAPSGDKPSTLQGETTYGRKHASPKKATIRDPRLPKSPRVAAVSPGPTPRRGLWGDSSIRRQRGETSSLKAELRNAASVASSPQASSISFQDMLQPESKGEVINDQ